MFKSNVENNNVVNDFIKDILECVVIGQRIMITNNIKINGFFMTDDCYAKIDDVNVYYDDKKNIDLIRFTFVNDMREMYIPLNQYEISKIEHEKREEEAWKYSFTSKQNTITFSHLSQKEDV